MLGGTQKEVGEGRGAEEREGCFKERDAEAQKCRRDEKETRRGLGRLAGGETAGVPPGAVAPNREEPEMEVQRSSRPGRPRWPGHVCSPRPRPSGRSWGGEGGLTATAGAGGPGKLCLRARSWELSSGE